MNEYKVTVLKRGIDVEYNFKAPEMVIALQMVVPFLTVGEIIKCEKI